MQRWARRGHHTCPVCRLDFVHHLAMAGDPLARAIDERPIGCFPALWRAIRVRSAARKNRTRPLSEQEDQ
jgi:hypothetical protein